MAIDAPYPVEYSLVLTNGLYWPALVWPDKDILPRDFTSRTRAPGQDIPVLLMDKNEFAWASHNDLLPYIHQHDSDLAQMDPELRRAFLAVQEAHTGYPDLEYWREVLRQRYTSQSIDNKRKRSEDRRPLPPKPVIDLEEYENISPPPPRRKRRNDRALGQDAAPTCFPISGAPLPANTDPANRTESTLSRGSSDPNDQRPIDVPSRASQPTPAAFGDRDSESPFGLTGGVIEVEPLNFVDGGHQRVNLKSRGDAEEMWREVTEARRAEDRERDKQDIKMIIGEGVAAKAFTMPWALASRAGLVLHEHRLPEPDPDDKQWVAERQAFKRVDPKLFQYVYQYATESEFTPVIVMGDDFQPKVEDGDQHVARELPREERKELLDLLISLFQVGEELGLEGFLDEVERKMNMLNLWTDVQSADQVLRLGAMLFSKDHHAHDQSKERYYAVAPEPLFRVRDRTLRYISDNFEDLTRDRWELVWGALNSSAGLDTAVFERMARMGRERAKRQEAEEPE